MGFFDFLKPKPNLPPEVENACKQFAFAAFPGGWRQIEEETVQLHALLRDRITKKEAGVLLRQTKIMLVVESDKSEAWITASILRSTPKQAAIASLVQTFLPGPNARAQRAHRQNQEDFRVLAAAVKNGKLSQPEAHLVYVFLTGISGPPTSGGDGSSAENAVIINATSSVVGVHEEYSYVERVCGKRDVDWSFIVQRLMDQNEPKYDVLCIRMKDGSTRDFWFDITSFFGRDARWIERGICSS